MKSRIIRTIIFVMICAICLQCLGGCYKSSDDEERERQEYQAKAEEKKKNADPKEIDFMETICGTYLVSGTGVMTGGATYDDTGSSETTFTNLAVHVVEAGEKEVQIDLEGDYRGNGNVSLESPTVKYTDVKGYDVTVTFSFNDGNPHIDMKIFGDLTLEDTGDYLTETMTLSGDK